MERISNRNSDIIQLPPPPPYTAVFKLDENESDGVPPPSYADVDTQSVTYINNYPGPPLADGRVQVSTSINPNIILSKNIRIYLIINGIITILFGIIVVGIQIGILASNSIIYYYYGFWGGAIIISIGISIVLLYKNHRNANYTKLFHSFFCEMVLIGIVFGIGIIILLTDKCDDNATDNGNNNSCKHTYKILNGFLFGIFSLAFLQSIINVVVFGILKRQHSINENPLF
jgi:hypothetical protein